MITKLYWIKILLIITLINTYAQDTGLIGTFYGGWGRNKGNYIWTENFGNNADFIGIADVNGDGYEDAYSVTNGLWEIALSVTEENFAGKNFRKFGEHQEWSSSFGQNAANVFVKDINNDQLADAIVFYTEKDGKEGLWEIALSNGTSFEQPEEVITGFGGQSDLQFFEDINGNGYPDAIIFNAEDKSWYVKINMGSSYMNAVQFATGVGLEDSKTMMDDINGDQRADVIVFKAGEVYVSLSGGTSFTFLSLWKSGFAGDRILTGDVDGDGRSDIISFTFDAGEWNYYKSNGTNAFGSETFWCTRHGGNNPRPSKNVPPATDFFTGFVQTAKTDDFGVSPVAFNKLRGRFQVMPPLNMFSNSRFQTGNSASWYNSYQVGKADQFLPFIDGEFYGFDSENDVFAIRYLISQLADAEIDYVLLDQSNPWNALKEAHLQFAREIKKWNDIPGNRKVRYAILGKYKRGPEEVEASAKNTWNDFILNPELGGLDNYQHWKGKPLLVCYGGVDQKPEKWEAYTGVKLYGNKFTLRWMNGGTDPESVGDNDPGHWYGWLMPEGTLESDEQMVAQPGYYNGNKFHSRYYNGIEADWYRVKFWDRILRKVPEKVTVIGFTGDTELVNVYIHKADKAIDMGKAETWETNDMYWKMTKNYIQNYRALKSGVYQHVADYGSVNANTDAVPVHFNAEFDQTPAVFALIENQSTETQKRIKISNVTTTGFTVNYLTGFESTDRINWIAVKPGNWEINNGMVIQAGISSDIPGSGPQEMFFDIPYASKPVLLSQISSNNNAAYSEVKQSNITKNGFTLTGISETGNEIQQSENMSWIAMNSDVYQFWSGRYCGTQILNNTSGESQIQINIDEEFYDKVLMLTKSNKDADPADGELLVTSTTDSSGAVVYQNNSLSSDSINVIYFDGGGGSLYGKPVYGTFSERNKLDPNEIRLAPNPAKDIIRVNLPETKAKEIHKLEILNILGHIVHTRNIDNSEFVIHQDLKEGIYILRFSGERNEIVKTVVVY